MNNDYSERDRTLLEQIGMSAEQVDSDAAKVESETTDDGLTGRVYYGLHLDHGDEQMVNVSLRLPKSTLDRLDTEAGRYHISRSEYMRRQLARA